MKTIIFDTIQFSVSIVSMSKHFYFKKFCLAKIQFVSFWPTDRTVSDATTRSQSGSRNDDNEEVLRIPQSSSITVTSRSDCFVLYLGYSLVGSYPSAEMQSVYSTAPADWAIWYRWCEVLPCKFEAHGQKWLSTVTYRHDALSTRNDVVGEKRFINIDCTFSTNWVLSYCKYFAHIFSIDR